MDGVELGRRLRARRTAADRTIASVAGSAGLSVPYIANLENGRGNPTLATLQRLATALGLRLEVSLTSAATPAPTTPEVTASLRQFSRSHRFEADVAQLARSVEVTEPEMRSRVIDALSAMEAACERDLTTLDWHRALDVIVLIHRGKDA